MERKPKPKEEEVLKVQVEQLKQYNYILAHNLKSPIGNLVKLINLIRIDPTDEMVLEHIEKQAIRLQTLLEQLNCLLELDQTIDDKYEALDLREICDQVIDLVADNTNSFEMNVDLQHTKPVVSIRAYLVSILQNLLGNSIKYRKADLKPHITVTSTDVRDGVAISIADNGIGFDLDNHDDIFKIYTRLKSDQSIDGKGLGLYLVKTQIEILGGKIKVESKKGDGTIITITLPDFDA